MMLKIRMNTEAANRAIADGKLGGLMENTMARLAPEAAYFAAEDGERTAFIFFDLDREDQIPGIAEPWFQATNARLDLVPVMNGDEVAAGIAAWEAER